MVCFGFEFTWVLFGRIIWLGFDCWLCTCADFGHFSGLTEGLVLVWGWYNMGFLV